MLTRRFKGFVYFLLDTKHNVHRFTLNWQSLQILIIEIFQMTKQLTYFCQGFLARWTWSVTSNAAHRNNNISSAVGFVWVVFLDFETSIIFEDQRRSLSIRATNAFGVSILLLVWKCDVTNKITKWLFWRLILKYLYLYLYLHTFISLLPYI